MATTTIIDYRRNDLRRYWHATPYWITSNIVSAVASDDLCAAVFSFPAAVYGSTTKILIEKVCCQVTTLMAGGTITVDVGSYTLATDAVTTGGVATVVDIDDYVPTANITSGTAATYFAATGDWITAKLLMTELTPVIIVPVDTTVPLVAVTITSDAAITAGACRVHMMITEVPIV